MAATNKSRELYSTSFSLFRRGDDAQKVARALRIPLSTAIGLKHSYLYDQAEVNRFYLSKLKQEREKAIASVLEQCKEKQEGFCIGFLEAERHAQTIFRLLPEVKEITIFLSDQDPLTLFPES